MIVKIDKNLDISEFLNEDIKYSQNEINEWLKLENVYLFKIVENNLVLSFSIFMKTDIDTYDLLYVYTKKNKRKSNLAYNVLKESINFLKNSKISIFLEVSENNASAIKLYEKLNFKKISIRKRYYKDDSNALIYKLEV